MQQAEAQILKAEQTVNLKEINLKTLVADGEEAADDGVPPDNFNLPEPEPR